MEIWEPAINFLMDFLPPPLSLSSPSTKYFFFYLNIFLFVALIHGRNESLEMNWNFRGVVRNGPISTEQIGTEI